MKTTRACIIAVLMLFLLNGKSSAYCILACDSCGCPQSGTGWPGAMATFHSRGFSGSNSTFDNAFVDALNNWNNLSNFSYSSINASVDPCGGPDSTLGRNSTRGWKFDSTNCGETFGSGVLAITVIWADSFTPSINNITDADITFNSAQRWDVHNGPGSNIDFKRVATRELGHAFGLNNDDTISALLNSVYSQTIEIPQAEDIKGLIALYGGNPLPDIKANGSDSTITPIDNLSVTVVLDPGIHSGENADWWVAANVSGTSTIDGWYYFDLSAFGFVPVGDSPNNLLATFQGPLFNLATFGIFNIPVSGLPSGTYTFYFAVDMNMNGLLDLGPGEIFVDFVVVNITL